jgi:hypothetical protein
MHAAGICGNSYASEPLATIREAGFSGLAAAANSGPVSAVAANSFAGSFQQQQQQCLFSQSLQDSSAAGVLFASLLGSSPESSPLPSSLAASPLCHAMAATSGANNVDNPSYCNAATATLSQQLIMLQDDFSKQQVSPLVAYHAAQASSYIGRELDLQQGALLQEGTPMMQTSSLAGLQGCIGSTSNNNNSSSSLANAMWMFEQEQQGALPGAVPVLSNGPKASVSYWNADEDLCGSGINLGMQTGLLGQGSSAAGSFVSGSMMSDRDLLEASHLLARLSVMASV